MNSGRKEFSLGAFLVTGKPDGENKSCNETAITPLLDAACRQHWTEVHRLLDARSSVNESGYGGQSALMFAARAGEVDVVNVLLAASADVNAPDLVRNTPLHEAAARGHSTCVAPMLEARADLWASGFRGATALDIAHREGHMTVVGVLEEWGAQGRWHVELASPGLPEQVTRAASVLGGGEPSPLCRLARAGDLQGVEDLVT